jgi:hypothetical protein
MVDRATWAHRVTEWRASGLTAARFCEGRGFSHTTLQGWSSKLAKEPAETPPEPIRMVRLLRRAAAEVAPGASNVLPSSAPIVVLEVGGARISVSAGVDRSTLMTVLESLGAYARGGGR